MKKDSLLKDKNDDAQFRHAYNRQEKDMLHQEFMSHVPFFFNEWGSEIDLVGHYKGRSIFLICNGPSVASDMYDLKKLKLPGVMTFGINNGPRTVRPNFWTCVDDPKRFMKSIWLDPQIAKFIPMTFGPKPLFDNQNWTDLVKPNGTPVKVRDCPNVVYYRRNEKFMANRFLVEDTINWGNSGDNGGGRSVMLPALRMIYLLGFRTVYLMGADFKMSPDYTYHFDEQRAKGAVNCNMATYDRMKSEYFPQLKEHFDAAGFKVFNCNPDSELKVFPQISFDEAIFNSINPLGELKNERTWGMYGDPKDPQKFANEPQESSKNHLQYSRAKNEAPVTGVDLTGIDLTNKNITTVKQLSKEIEKVAETKTIDVSHIVKNKIETAKVFPTVTQVPKPSVPQIQQKIIKSKPCGDFITGSSNNG